MPLNATDEPIWPHRLLQMPQRSSEEQSSASELALYVLINFVRANSELGAGRQGSSLVRFYTYIRSGQRTGSLISPWLLTDHKMPCHRAEGPAVDVQRRYVRL